MKDDYKDDDIEEWIFTLSLSRILSLRFEHGKLINIFGG